MTKADIINKIAESTGLQKKDVSVVVESFMENIKDSLLSNKENVYLRGFGSFIIKHRAAKTAPDATASPRKTAAVCPLPPR